VRYKTSEEGEERVRRNQENVRKKAYHHKTGSGGYRTTIPKWEKMEQDLVAKGVNLFSLNWLERSKNWFFVHGGSLDTESGAPRMSPAIREAIEILFNIVDTSTCGVFVPR
jgi:hypothetical protein